MARAVAVVDVQTGEILDHGHRTEDEWETYIREVGIENAILERARRWHEFYQDCQANHGKQGGSRFAEFAKARFGMKQSVAARWSLIGEHHGQLIRDANKFAADHAMQITRRLLELADDLDLDRGVIGMAMIGAGIMLLAEVDPVTAEGVAGVLEGQSAKLSP